jgi:hypothetical protein
VRLAGPSSAARMSLNPRPNAALSYSSTTLSCNGGRV